MDVKTIMKQIEETRVSVGMKRKDLCAAAGISLRTYYRLRDGATLDPKIGTILRLRKAVEKDRIA